MHKESIHNIFIIPELKFVISSGFDSTLKVWKPPETWEKKFVVTHSMINGMDPKENLSTIKEEHESYGESQMLKRRITGLDDNHNNNNHDPNQFHSLLNQGNQKDVHQKDILQMLDHDDDD